MYLRSLWLILCPLLITTPAVYAQIPLPYQALASKLHIDHHEMEASPEDWLWLRHKSELKVGVSASESAPFSIKTAENQYEGISADTTNLISQLLGVPLKVVPFANDEEAEQALIAGTIDLISGNHGQASPLDLIFSKPYTQDRLAVFKRRSESRHSPANLAGLSVAVTREHINELQQLYPRANFKVYSDHDKAIAAAAFGQADVYLDDLYSAYYQINRSFYGYLSFERFSELSIDGYRYAFRGDNTRLQGLVNSAIVAIGENQMRHFAMRWVGNNFVPRSDPIDLTVQESRWIERHPVVRLVINDDLAPSAYFDSNGVFIGSVADLLEVITLSTGLHFQVTSYSGSFSQIMNALQTGDSDLALMTASPEREEFLRFSRPLFVDPFVLLTNSQEKHKLVDLADKRVAIATGHVAIKSLQELYPKAILIEAGSTVNSMNLLYEGQVDAAVTALPAARYYIERLFRDKLVVTQALDIEPGTISFAYQRRDAELQSIIEKVLQSMEPDELNTLYNRWRSPPGMSGETWINYERVIRQIVLAAVVMLLLALVWVFYLRREVKVRTKAEQKLNDQLRFVETLTDCMPPSLYVCDSNGRMVSCNRSFLKSVGLSSEQVLNKTSDQLPSQHFESSLEFHQEHLHAIRDSQTIESVHTIQLQGKEVWISHWVQPFQNSKGITQGIICGWLDITEHRQLVQQLQEAKSHADEASRAKSSFLATMSHEIRTPMNAVIGILELALKRADSVPIDRASIEIAHTSAKSLLELIGDILDIARIESGRLSLSPKRTNLRELIESVARVFEGLARQKRLNLVLEIDSSINCDVLVDTLRFKQILSNLVSNAIKFTEEGAVKVSITGVLIDSSLLNVRLSVEDTGVGISLTDQQRLFRPFTQVQRIVQQTEGSGLGLVICRSLCEMMGGRLSMNSALGRGTQIDVELRLQVLERISISPMLATPVHKQRYRLQVLVVDDHKVNRKVLSQQLAFLGHDVSEAENGREGFEHWREQPFDIVITDCHMPIMGGIELTRAIRRAELESAQEPTVIIGLTADAQPEELELCILAGMNDCLIKPIGIDDLDARLLEHYLADDVDQPATEQLISIPDSFKLVDLAPLELLISNEPIKFQQILDELIKSNRKDCQMMQVLLQNGEIDSLVELAHRIKGAARVVKGEQLVECCRRLETACQNSKIDSGQLQQLVGQVEVAIAALEHALLSLRQQ
ncbi:hybrid sensor histidine kinase/response regulator [Pseudomonas protegens]|uniref:transporter substrate-binding domain-containing protein n=2 Tax=Pseudomonas protegens TaxID=380021 RepID=UPI000CCFE1F5|nr:hybrid sensor histidine kinase/response regulator [Pseudomonas protegens]